ncbi:MAG: hypothetical protein AB7O67_06505 [Vicinamibacterales bacterium]
MSHVRRLACLVMLLVAVPVVAGARQVESPTLFRVFLQDGSTLTSYGEWARVGDRVVFSMPLAANAGPSAIHLVSIPAERVDWARTERYADHARATAYAAARGEADFAAMSAEVAATLNSVARAETPEERLRIAERARRALADWPARHFGYRAGEVQEILGLLDEIVAELRATAGLGRFDLALSARTVPPPTSEPLLAPPSQAEIVQQLMAASALAGTPVERVSLLQTVVGLIDHAVGVLPEAWAASIRRTALGGIAEEARLDREYAELRHDVLQDADKYAARADVRALRRLRQDVVSRDRRLGVRRAGEIAALLATVDAQLDAAQRLRLARDRWQLRRPAYKAYVDGVEPTMRTLEDAIEPLGAIRAMAGPEPRALLDINERLARERYRLVGIRPPEELASLHALIQSAQSLAANATALRIEAIRTGSLEQAQQASSAAAGALMLAARARQDLDATLQPPTIE